MDNNGRTLRNVTLNLPTTEILSNGQTNRLTNATITPSGKIYVNFNGGRAYLLDPDSLQWTPIVPPVSYFGVYGSDGENVIMGTVNSDFGWFLLTP
jgi:hypothetical protein